MQLREPLGRTLRTLCQTTETPTLGAFAPESARGRRNRVVTSAERKFRLTLAPADPYLPINKDDTSGEAT